MPTKSIPRKVSPERGGAAHTYAAQPGPPGRGPLQRKPPWPITSRSSPVPANSWPQPHSRRPSPSQQPPSRAPNGTSKPTTSASPQTGRVTQPRAVASAGGNSTEKSGGAKPLPVWSKASHPHRHRDASLLRPSRRDRKPPYCRDRPERKAQPKPPWDSHNPAMQQPGGTARWTMRRSARRWWQRSATTRSRV